VNLHHAVETYRGHTIPHFPFMKRRRTWFTVSAVVLLLGLAGFLIRGLNLSIEFEGGAQIVFPIDNGLTVQDIDATMAEFGLADAEVQVAVGGEGQEASIRTESLTDEARGVVRALAEQADIPIDQVSVQDIGPTWGSEISSKALQGLIVVLIAIMIYISLRFEPTMAVGAVVALLHDIFITIGIYALVGREVTPETVIAILTILGFSLYDTVVIYDKVQENAASTSLMNRVGYDGVVDLSLNQVLMRSINTTLVVLFPVLALLLFGGVTLKNFAFAMFVGVTVGAYSSIFIAAPLLAIFKGRDPRNRPSTRGRHARQVDDLSSPSTAAVSDAAAQHATARSRSEATRSGGQARPRPKGKRRPPPKKKRRR
jgi:preprotein translocase subunit SecF